MGWWAGGLAGSRANGSCAVSAPVLHASVMLLPLLEVCGPSHHVHMYDNVCTRARVRKPARTHVCACRVLARARFHSCARAHVPLHTPGFYTVYIYIYIYISIYTCIYIYIYLHTHILYYTILYSTLLYSTLLYSTLLYSTIL